MKNFTQSFFTTKGKTIKLAFSLITVFLLNSNCIFGQTPSNGGFENGTTDWTTTGSISTTNARTGVNSLLSASSSSTTNTAHTNANTVSVNPNKYGITIGWAKGSNTFSSASAGGTLNGTTGSSTTASIGTTLTRLTYVSAQNVGGSVVTFSGRMNSRTSTANNSTQVYFDDMIIYESTTATPDVTKPTAATAFTNGSISSSAVNFSWTAGSDAGTGIQRTIVLRTSNLSAATPVMNDQCIYSTLGSTAGPNVVGPDWTVMMTNGAATSLTYTDNTVTPNTSYKYAVIYRDLAYNYSAALVSGTISVPSGLSTDSKLFSLSTSIGLSPTFASGTFSYSNTTPFSTTSVSVTATRNQANATMAVRINGGTYTSLANSTQSSPLSLNVGANTIDVRVTAQDGTTQSVYTWTVTRAAASNDATLSNFTTTASGFSPTFASSTFTGYSATVSYGYTTINVRAYSNQSGAALAVRINGGSYSALASGSAGVLSLNVGANPIDVRVTAEDGTTQNVYTLTVTRGVASNDSSLSAFYITPFPLGAPTPVVTPTFASGTFSYSTTTVLPYSNSQVTVNASRNQSGASLAVRINGGSYLAMSSSSYGPLTLNVGVNIIDVRVTAEDGTTQSVYTLTVTRAGSTDATLLMLYTTAGTLSPSFASDTTAYTASVANTTTSVTVTPCKNQANATVAVQVNSGGYSAVTSCTPSSGLSLNVGSNAIDIRVTAQDGTTIVTYTITVTRAAENSVTTPTILTTGALSAFTSCAGTTSAQQSFTVSGANLTANIIVTPPTGFELSTISGSGFTSSVTLTQSGGSVASTTVYARLTALASETVSGNISCVSTGATSKNVAVSGNVNVNATPTFTAVAPICSGVTLSALPTTSSNGITGTWLPALNNTTTTTYTFTPSAGQCATTTTLTVTVNPNTTPTFTAVAPICSGATLSALPTTSNNGITGTWLPALNNTTTTTYTFTPSAGQCATTTTLTVTVNPNTTPTFTSVAPICSGATLSALPTTSNNGITGTWLPALNNTTTTTYTFTPSAGQCSNAATMTITVNATPAPTASAQTFSSGATVANLVATGTALKWYTVPTGGTNLPTSTPLAIGTYYVSQTLNGCESARTSVAVTVASLYTAIPDANFEQALFDLGIDTVNGDHQVLTSNVSGVTSLDVSNASIVNLTGIAAFSSLTDLNCSSNRLTSLNVSGLSNLYTLNCSYNWYDNGTTFSYLTSINVNGLSNLSTLDCSGNVMLSSLNLTGLSNLFELRLSGNNFSTINLSGLSNLSLLDISYNKLTSLNIAGTGIYYLDCSNNLLTTLVIPIDSNLSDLRCDYNNLTSLDLTSTSLVYFSSTNNYSLSCISVADVDLALGAGWIIDSWSTFKLLSSPCIYTAIPDPNFEQALIDLGHDTIIDGKVLTSAVTGITTLNVSNKSISKLYGIKSFTALQHLNCSSNSLYSLDLIGLSNLITIDCSANSIAEFLMTNTTNLTSLNCSYNYYLTSLNLFGLTNLNTLVCGYNQLTSLNFTGLTHLAALDCSNNSLPTLSYSGLTTLTSLDCSGTERTSLSLSGLTNLVSLKFSDNLLTTINLTGLSNLKTLDCSNNKLSTISLSGLSLLETFSCGGNLLTSLSLSNMPALKNLSCFGSYTVTSNGNGFTTIFNSVLTSLTLTGLSNLENLDCSRNKLTTMSLIGLNSLKSLKCGNNNFSSLSLNASDFPSLIDLDCSGFFLASKGTISSLNLIGFSNLKTLSCSHNLLSSFNITGLTSLTSLYCGSNSFTSLNVNSTNFPALNYLDCSGYLTNQGLINSLNLTGLSNAVTVNCTGNPSLTCIEVSDTVTAAANTNWTKDAIANYSTNCNQASNNLSVNLKLFIEGFYDTTTNAMRSVIANQGVGSSSTDVDTVTIELHDAITYALVTSTNAMLQTNGIVVANFSTTQVGSYYLVVKHRNSLETWSALPYSFGATPLTYDFTTAADKAYGNNMKMLATGVYGFYSGDLNQDGFIESGDYPSLYNDSDAGLEGYYSTDLNGDGFVESGDYPILFNNSDSGIEISRP